MRDQLGENIAATVADEVGADEMEVNIFWLVLPPGTIGREFGAGMCDWLYRDSTERNDL